MITDAVGPAGKWMLGLGAIMFAISGGLITFIIGGCERGTGPDDLTFDLWLNERWRIFTGSEMDTPFALSGEPLRGSDITRSSGGQLEWMQTLSPFGGESVSTPVLADLDGNGDLEVVVASSGDAVFALEADGDLYWDEPYVDDVIDFLGQTSGTSGLDFEPPPFFTSPVVADVLSEVDIVHYYKGPEILLGVKNGALCLDSNGAKVWKKGLTTGYYFSTPCVTDLEGMFSANIEDREMVIASDDESRRAWLEALDVRGNTIFRDEAPSGGEGALVGTAVVAHDLDGDFWDGPYPVTPDSSKETDTELIIGNHDRGLRIWGKSSETGGGKPIYKERNGNSWLGGHQTYATSAVANVSGGPDCELFVGSSEGYTATWTGWGGKVYAYDPQGRKLWDFYTGSSDASVFSSPAVADLQCAVNDPYEEHLEYELIFGCDNGCLYVVNTEYHNLEWYFDTGGRVLSSPAVCNIDRDNELEIVIGSDSGKVFCLDGDPTDGVDEGVAYPGDGAGQDVLWVYDAKNPIGISSPAVADIDLDGSLEVVIGDQEGHVYCISAGGVCLRGQADWPMFHCNANRTGLYDPSMNFGVDIHASRCGDGTLQSLVLTAEPGNEVTYNLTVENTGMGPLNVARDVIYLKVDESSVPCGWDAWIDTPPDNGRDDPPYVRLKAGEGAEVALHVRSPREGFICKMARVNVSCNSSSDVWARDSISTHTLVNVSLEFELGFGIEPSVDPLDPIKGKKWTTMAPGKEREFRVTLGNEGNLNASYDIELIDPPYEAGWDWHFTDTMELHRSSDLSTRSLAELYGGSSSESMLVKVIVPEWAPKDQMVPIRINAVSTPSGATGVGNLADKDELWILVGEETDIRIETDEPVMFTYPNVTVEHTIHVTNNGNEDLIEVVLSLGVPLAGWRLYLPPDPITVYMGQTKDVKVKVTPAGHACAGEKQVIAVTGKVKGSPEKSDEVELTTVVNQVYSFDAVMLSKDGIRVSPGGASRFSIQVSNLGNGDDLLDLHAFEMGPLSKVSFYTKDGAPRKAFELAIHQNLGIDGRVEVPEGTGSGWYSVGINFKGLGSERTVELMVHVNQSFGLEVSSLDGLHRIKERISPDREKELIVAVRNTGNGFDRVVLSMAGAKDRSGNGTEGFPEDWSGTFIGVSNVQERTTNIRTVDLRTPLLVTSKVPDVYYISNRSIGGQVDPPTTDLRDVFLLLDRGEYAFVHFLLKAPSTGTPSSISSFDLKAIGTGGKAGSDKATFDLELLFPNLQFEGDIAISGGKGSGGSQAKPGQLITIRIMVKNTGGITAEYVDVSLYVDGVRKKTQTLMSVKSMDEPGAEAIGVAFTWVAEAGDHRMKVVIDPDDTIVEAEGGEGDDNILTRSVKVSSGSLIEGLYGKILGLVMILLFGILIIAVSALAVRSRRRYP